MPSIAYKTLRKDGRSIRDGSPIYYPLPKNGKPGEWIEVPGNGAYCAELGGDLFHGGTGDILVRMEVEEEVPVDYVPAGVRCWRKVRVLEIVPWTEIPDAYPEWKFTAAVCTPSLNEDERIQLLLSTLSHSPSWCYYAASSSIRLTDAGRRTLVMAIPPDAAYWRYVAACFVPGLTKKQRRELVMSIPVDQWKYLPADVQYASYLTDEDRRKIDEVLAAEQTK